jgi:hypothetical protein
MRRRCLSTARVTKAKRAPSGEKEERVAWVKGAADWARAEVDWGRPLDAFVRDAAAFLDDGILLRSRSSILKKM